MFLFVPLNMDREKEKELYQKINKNKMNKGVGVLRSNPNE